MESNYTKIFTGNSFTAHQIVSHLHGMGIEAIVKDEAESGRLAGFATTSAGLVDIFVHKDEVEKAVPIVEKLSDE
ncbi:putative signal transducing protein [Maribacter algicola]|uniref:Signal transducing protein n=1 Tax=Meishania litoralis TaxID=3434685 RepID=A0ACC7LMX4_9FLAO